MLKRKLLALLLALLLLVSALSGCTAAPDAAMPVSEPAPQAATAAPAPAPEQTGVRFTDMGGNEIALAAPATKIVALTPADVEILFAIGAGDALVGCGEYCDYPAEAAAIPVMQTGAELNLEQLLVAKPEVLLLNPSMLATDAVASTQAQVDRLAGAGIQLVISDAHTVSDVYDAIAMLGKLTGKTENAAALVRSMQDAFTGVTDIEAAHGKSVYFEISPLEYGLWTAGAGTFMDEVAGMLGLTNCFADVADYAAISEEQVIARNPDYIVTITMYFGEGSTPTEEILSRPGWENVTAVQNGAVLELSDNALSRPGPRLAEGARRMGEWLAGSALADAA